jgi:hypothetical protein
MKMRRGSGIRRRSLVVDSRYTSQQAIGSKTTWNPEWHHLCRAARFGSDAGAGSHMEGLCSSDPALFQLEIAWGEVGASEVKRQRLVTARFRPFGQLRLSALKRHSPRPMPNGSNGRTSSLQRCRGTRALRRIPDFGMLHERWLFAPPATALTFQPSEFCAVQCHKALDVEGTHDKSIVFV